MISSTSLEIWLRSLEEILSYRLFTLCFYVTDVYVFECYFSGSGDLSHANGSSSVIFIFIFSFDYWDCQYGIRGEDTIE